jgi:hypothetical protein
MGGGDLKFGLFPYGKGNQVACFLMVRGPKQLQRSLHLLKSLRRLTVKLSSKESRGRTLLQPTPRLAETHKRDRGISLAGRDIVMSWVDESVSQEGRWEARNTAATKTHRQL